MFVGQYTLNSFNMKSLPILLMSFWCSCGTLVLNVPNQENHTLLTLEQSLELSQTITFCIRFNFKGYSTPRYIFTSKNSELALRFRLSVGQGYVTLNGKNLIFEIPKDTMHPHSWHHLCFSSGNETYQIVVEGKEWFQGKFKSNFPWKVSTNQFMIGSFFPDLALQSDYEDFFGELSELNIWGKMLSTSTLKNITKNCSHTNPVPDVLQWSNDVSLKVLTGSITELEINELCHRGNQNITIHKVLPIFLDQHDSIHACQILGSQLAYPKSQEEYNLWHSKFFKRNCK